MHTTHCVLLDLGSTLLARNTSLRSYNTQRTFSLCSCRSICGWQLHQELGATLASSAAEAWRLVRNYLLSGSDSALVTHWMNLASLASAQIINSGAEHCVTLLDVDHLVWKCAEKLGREAAVELAHQLGPTCARVGWVRWGGAPAAAIVEGLLPGVRSGEALARWCTAGPVGGPGEGRYAVYGTWRELHCRMVKVGALLRWWCLESDCCALVSCCAGGVSRVTAALVVSRE